MNDARTLARRLSDEAAATGDPDLHAAAALLDVFAPIYDSRPPCDTCGGTGFVETQLDRPYVALVGGPCPDCGDGRLPIGQHIARLLQDSPPCPYVHTADEGTQYCTLNGPSVGSQ